MKQIVSIAAVLAVAVILPGRLLAGFVYFDNRNDFEAAIGGAPSGFESFETLFAPAASVDFPIGGPAEFSLSESGDDRNEYQTSPVFSEATRTAAASPTMLTTVNSALAPSISCHRLTPLVWI